MWRLVRVLVSNINLKKHGVRGIIRLLNPIFFQVTTDGNCFSKSFPITWRCLFMMTIALAASARLPPTESLRSDHSNVTFDPDNEDDGVTSDEQFFFLQDSNFVCPYVPIPLTPLERPRGMPCCFPRLQILARQFFRSSTSLFARAARAPAATHTLSGVMSARSCLAGRRSEALGNGRLAGLKRCWRSAGQRSAAAAFSYGHCPARVPVF